MATPAATMTASPTLIPGQTASSGEVDTYPLSTIFTPSPSCYGSIYTMTPYGSDTWSSYSAWTDQIATSIPSHGGSPGCFPSSATMIYNDTTLSDAVLTYQPATCFGGYYPAILSTSDPFTIATCCPTYYVPGNPSLGTNCFRNHSTPTKVTIVNSSTTTTAVTIEVAQPHWVTWEAKDESLWTTSAQTPTTTATPSPQTKSQLSASTKGGIAAGVIAFALISTAIIAALFIRRRKRIKGPQITSDDTLYKAELSGESRPLPEIGHEGAVYEAEDSSKPPEADATVRAELETDWTGWEAPALLEVDLSRPRMEEDPAHGTLLSLAESAENQAPQLPMIGDSGAGTAEHPGTETKP